MAAYTNDELLRLCDEVIGRAEAPIGQKDYDYRLSQAIAAPILARALKSRLQAEDPEDVEVDRSAALVNTDGASPDTVLAAVKACAASWVPEARILGNVRAGDIVRALTRTSQAEAQAPAVTREDCPIDAGPVTLATVIAQLKDHRATHLDWGQWLERHPEDANTGTGDAMFQKGCVVHYDKMIAYLESLTPSSQAEAQAPAVLTATEVKTCPRCKGTGDDPVQGHPDHYFACDLCDGAKLVRVRERVV